ncbi:MAG: hypothetical protein CL760_10945 [Chloroflexi bacterium]|nr:hypothetical protein [Chloroflexota bacterium]
MNKLMKEHQEIKKFRFYKLFKELITRADECFVSEVYKIEDSYIFNFSIKHKEKEFSIVRFDIYSRAPIFNNSKESRVDLLFVNSIFLNKSREIKNYEEIKEKKYVKAREHMDFIIEKLIDINIPEELLKGAKEYRDNKETYLKEKQEVYGIRIYLDKEEPDIKLQYLCFQIQEINKDIDFEDAIKIANIVYKQKKPESLINKIKEDLLDYRGEETLEKIELLYSR